MLGALDASAQTIRPILSEYRGEANGRFELVNDTFRPANIVLEAKSFTVSENGEISYRPLDPGIEVRFSTKSFRMQPKQTYSVAYHAKAAALPAYFVVYAGFNTGKLREESGVNIQILLPHTVYILPKKDAAKNELQVREASYDTGSRKINFDVASKSLNFARVLVVELVGQKSRVEAAGFPVYPQRNRKSTVEWKEAEPPRRVVFHFRDFKLEAPIASR
jgi:hypothetical protein